MTTDSIQTYRTPHENNENIRNISQCNEKPVSPHEKQMRHITERESESRPDESDIGCMLATLAKYVQFDRMKKPDESNFTQDIINH